MVATCNSHLAQQIEEIEMKLLGKTALVLGLAGAMALGSMTASEARGGRNAAAIGAGVAGFAAGAAIGSAAAANSGYYYGSPGYYDGYDSYAYEPGYVAPAYTPPSYYGPVGGYGYDSNYNGPWHERHLEGRD
jgi:hypothetical protein